MEELVLDKQGSYQDLKVWQKAMDLTELVYEASASLPSEEKFGLTAQMRRCAVSVPSNIAEGYGRDSDGSFVQFLRTSQGSLKELETQIILSGRLGFMKPDIVRDLLNKSDEIGKMLRGLIVSVQRKQN